MQISYQYQGKWHIKKLSADVVTVGRPNNREGIHIDLSPDTTVSRLHARVWLENEVCWLEDLGSRYGTKVNGAQITGRVQLQAGDTLEIGETALRVDPAPDRRGRRGLHGAAVRAEGHGGGAAGRRS